MKHFIKNLYYSIKNLISWIPIIWNDRQWDHSFLYKILNKKLSLMEDYFADSKIVLDKDEIAKEIHYCVERLDRIISHDYITESLKPLFEKYPGIDDDWLDKNFVEREDGLVEYISSDTPEQSELRMKCYEEANKNMNDDLDELFAQIRLYHEHWWD